MAHSVFDGLLELTNRHFLDYSEEGNAIYQVEDGTRYYYKCGPPNVLYVQWQLSRAPSHGASRIQAEVRLPEGCIRSVAPFGNAIYVAAGCKVYKAVFTLADGIIVSHVQDLSRNEMVHSAGLCSLVLSSGKQYAHRMRDDFSRSGILLDVPEGDMEGLKLWCIHKGKAYFISDHSASARPSIRKLCENAVVLEICSLFGDVKDIV